MSSFRPFFLNLNLCMSLNDISTYEKFNNIIARNTGNSYIGYSLIKILFGEYRKVDCISNIWNYDFSDYKNEAAKINEKYTHVIFSLQDQINNFPYFANLPFDKINLFLKQINLPVIAAGIGCNSTQADYSCLHKNISKDRIKFLQILSEKSNMIGTRGHLTTELLRKLGIENSLPVGCPTFFEENNPNRKIIKTSSIEENKILYNSVFLMPQCDNNKFMLQDQDDLIKLTVFDDYSNFKNINPWTRKLFKLGLNENLRVFSSMTEWKEYTKNFDFVFGSRVHGAILALNSIKENGSGVPALIVNDDVRSKEMTELFKIPYIEKPYGAVIDDIKEINSCFENADFEAMNKQFPLLYSDFHHWLKINGIAISSASDTERVDEPSLKLKPAEEVLDKIFIDLENKTELLDEKQVVEYYINVGRKSSFSKIKKYFLSNKFKIQYEKSLKFSCEKQNKYKILKHLNQYELQDALNQLAKRNKRIVLYGAGLVSDVLFDNFDLSNLNIIAVSDRKFETPTTYRGFKAVPPSEIKGLKPDLIISALFMEKSIKSLLKQEKIKTKLFSIV